MVSVSGTKESAYSSNAERWEAVKQRDPNAGGAFYYAVATTGVYCRPNCPSRLARRENVLFYANRSEAERGGFRPCMRCRPGGAPISARYAQMVTRACRAIETA